jgi:3-isopropylmalate/(R)-2-methylmalate dehydratase large subunit
MAQTLAQKILARAAGRRECRPGEYLRVRSNCPTVLAHHSVMNKGGGLVLELGGRVFDPAKVRIVDGHLGATASHQAGDVRVATHRWAEQVGVPRENIYDLGRSGVETMVSVEHCWPLPGELYLQGVNGHVSTAGALGAFVSALSYGTGGYLATGETWVRVPRTIRIRLTGRTRPGVYPRDVSESVICRLGHSGAIGRVLEWSGDYIDGLSMDQRFGLCSQALFTGAWTSIIAPDAKTIDYVTSRTERAFDALASDPGADYDADIVFDVGQTVPQVVVPPRRHDVRPVTDVVGTPITRGFVGSDANGWLDDMRVVGEFLAGRVIDPTVILNVTPGTVSVLRAMVDEGIFTALLGAECVVPTPNEGMEWGANTPLGPGEVCIATAQTNYPGRMGSDGAQIFLASPATVAASCLHGRITDPRDMFPATAAA